MATVLETYNGLLSQVETSLAKSPATANHVWWYGELVYRIGVLETCQMFCRSAPVSMEQKMLLGHYQMVDAYIRCLSQERRYGPNRGPDTQKERDTSGANLARVILDYQKRFSSFAPADPEMYGRELGKVINTVLPAWLQFRNTFVPIKRAKEGNA